MSLFQVLSCQVGVSLQPIYKLQGATYRIRVVYSLVVALSMGHVAGNLSSSKVLKKHKTGFHFIGATRAVGIFRGSSVAMVQAFEEQLRARVPRLLHGHIK